MQPDPNTAREALNFLYAQVREIEAKAELHDRMVVAAKMLAQFIAEAEKKLSAQEEPPRSVET